jgi:tetratricopeptide (TPR) repeat protein
MRYASRAVLLFLTIAVIGLAGCRSTRYSIGAFFSPDWLKSKETKDRYTIHSNNAQNYYSLGTDSRSQGDMRRAARNYRQAETQFKRAIEYDGYSFKAHLGAAFAMKQQGTREKLIEAIDYLEIAEDLRSGDWRVYYGLADCYQRLAGLDGEMIDRLEAQKPGLSEADRMVADAQILAARERRTGYLETALDQTENIKRYSPDQHQAFFITGIAAAQLHRYDQAIPNLQKFIQLARQSREVYTKWLDKGLPPSVRGNRQDSREELRMKIQKNLMKEAEAKDILATIYKNQGDYAKALEYLDSIYEANPRALPRFLAARAQIKAEMGDFSGAVDDLDTFIRALGRSGHEYDAIVDRAMKLRRDYLAKSRRRASGKSAKSTGSTP